MPSAVEVILVPTIMILLGEFLNHYSILRTGDREALTNIVLYIALPALVFVNIRNASISQEMLFLPVLGIVLSAILLFITYLYCKARGYSKKTSWTIMIAASLMNTGFIGFPVCMGVFGNEGFLNAIFFDLSSTVIVVVYGIVLASKFGGDKREAIKKVLTFVPLWALLLGIIFNVFHLQLFYVADTILDYFAQATIPLIMLALGLSLDARNIRQYLSDSLVVSVIKLVISPAIIFVLLTLLNIKGMAYNVAILEAGMSTAGNSLVLANTYDLDSDMMSSLLFVNVMLSLLTLTVIITLLA